MVAPLNWREVQQIAAWFQSLWGRNLTDRISVERVFIPARPDAPQGYLRNEWCLRLNTGREIHHFTLNLRQRLPHITLAEGKGPPAAKKATESVFGLSLSKYLEGSRLRGIHTLPNERYLILDFESRSGPSVSLVLLLIPNGPDALIVEEATPGEAGQKILARIQTSKTEIHWKPPPAREAPQDVSIRPEISADPRMFFQQVQTSLQADFLDLKKKNLEKSLRDRIKTIQSQIRQAREALDKASTEPDWKRYGDLLKATLHSPPPCVNGKRIVTDFESGQPVELPCDSGLDPGLQADAFYHRARRLQRKQEDLTARLRDAEADLQSYNERLKSLEGPEESWRDWVQASAATQKAKTPSQATSDEQPGKTFQSQEGLTIRVGRSRDENLLVTLRAAKGNDIWLHARGRPSAHVVIHIPAGKSASLETLLDAANLLLHYSGGKEWGKTEIDYTHRKHVKRIKNSTEVSYSQNKTLHVTPDPERLKRLLQT